MPSPTSFALTPPPLQAVNFSFDSAMAALSEMTQPAAPQDSHSSARLTPEAKMNFLQVVFDKINPAFISQVLTKYKWSVEAALDEILAAEEQRFGYIKVT